MARRLDRESEKMANFLRLERRMTQAATHGKQVASASEEWRALPKPCGVASNSFGTAGITSIKHMPAAQGGPRGGAVMDLRTGKWKMASTPLFPPLNDYDRACARSTTIMVSWPVHGK